MNNSFVKALINVFGAIPILWLVILYLFTALCWLNLGHFPIPSLNDPKSLGFSPLYFISIIGMLFTLVAVPIWVLLMLVTMKHKLLSNKRILLLFAGSTIAYVQLFMDPFHLIYWMLD